MSTLCNDAATLLHYSQDRLVHTCADKSAALCPSTAPCACPTPAAKAVGGAPYGCYNPMQYHCTTSNPQNGLVSGPGVSNAGACPSPGKAGCSVRPCYSSSLILNLCFCLCYCASVQLTPSPAGKLACRCPCTTCESRGLTTHG